MRATAADEIVCGKSVFHRMHCGQGQSIPHLMQACALVALCTAVAMLRGIDRKILPAPFGSTALVVSLVLFAINAVLLLVILKAVLSDLATFGMSSGQTLSMRLVPSFALAAALAGLGLHHHGPRARSPGQALSNQFGAAVLRRPRAHDGEGLRAIVWLCLSPARYTRRFSRARIVEGFLANRCDR